MTGISLGGDSDFGPLIRCIDPSQEVVNNKVLLAQSAHLCPVGHVFREDESLIC